MRKLSRRAALAGAIVAAAPQFVRAGAFDNADDTECQNVNAFVEGYNAAFESMLNRATTPDWDLTLETLTKEAAGRMAQDVMVFVRDLMSLDPPSAGIQFWLAQTASFGGLAGFFDSFNRYGMLTDARSWQGLMAASEPAIAAGRKVLGVYCPVAKEGLS